MTQSTLHSDAIDVLRILELARLLSRQFGECKKTGVPAVKSGTCLPVAGFHSTPVIHRLYDEHTVQYMGMSSVHRDSTAQQRLNVALEVRTPNGADRRRALSVDL